MQELVSIIMPVYNSERFIEQTIKSVLNQTYNNWELFIIDDCSSDKSIEIVKDISSNDKRIKLITLEINNGPAFARNKGIELANGKYIAFLDSDDIWHSEKLEKQTNFMANNNYFFTFTSFQRIDRNNNILSNKLINLPYMLTYNDLLKTNCIGCLTVMYDASVLDKIYMPNILKRQDYLCWLNILKMDIRAYYLKKQYASYRVHRKSLSSNKLSSIFYQWYIYRSLEKFNYFKSLYYMIYYLYFAIKKRLA